MYTVAALTLERYLFLNQYRRESHNFKRETLRIPFFLLVSWILAFLFALPKTLVIDKKTATLNDYELKWHESTQKLFFSFELLIAFIIPFTVIMVFSIKILIFVERWPKNSNSFQRIIRRRTKTFIITIVVTFLMTWLPFWTFQIYDNFFEEDTFHIQTWNKIVLIINYSNGVINPLLYMFLTNNFRDYLKIFSEKIRKISLNSRNTNDFNYTVVANYIHNASVSTRKSFLTASTVQCKTRMFINILFKKFMLIVLFYYQASSSPSTNGLYLMINSNRLDVPQVPNM